MMQLFATLLVASGLAVFALAAPLANTIKVNSACSVAAPNFLSGPQVGQGTWFEPALGACGITNTNSDLIAAVSWKLFDNFPGYRGGNPNLNPICGRKIHAEYKGKSVDITISDRCTGCDLRDLDFTPGAFSHLADPSVGRLNNVTWTWIS